jgi:oxygen-dependent protoporphyrinogen oxidase
MWPFVVTPIFSWPGKLRMALEWFIPPRRPEGDESLAQFVERRLGREALERMAQPMIAGIYGADPRALSLRATMPRFLEMERTHGSVIRAMVARRNDRKDEERGMRNEESAARPHSSSRIPRPSPLTGVSGARYGLFVSFREGMQSLVDALVERLPEGCVRRSARVSRLSRQENGAWRVELGSRDTSTPSECLEADAVCVALPASGAAALLKQLDPELAGRLAAIPYASAATINLAYRREDVPHPLDGFGFVVPAVEKRSLLGCTFSSVKFPGRAPESHALLRAFLGESSVASSEAAVEAAVGSDLRDLLGISAPPCFTVTRRHERAMPQYNVGHLDRIAEIEAAVARHPGLALAGSAYRGIGIPDCIHSGEQAAERLMG